MFFCRCLRIRQRFARTSTTAAAAVSICHHLNSSCLLTLKRSADVASVARRPMRQSLGRNTRSTLTYCRMFVARKMHFVTTLKLLFSCRYYVVITSFLPARRYANAGLCDSDVSVCPSVRHTSVLCLAERKQDREMYTI